MKNEEQSDSLPYRSGSIAQFLIERNIGGSSLLRTHGLFWTYQCSVQDIL